MSRVKDVYDLNEHFVISNIFPVRLNPLSEVPTDIAKLNNDIAFSCE